MGPAKVVCSPCWIQLHGVIPGDCPYGVHVRAENGEECQSGIHGRILTLT